MRYASKTLFVSFLLQACTNVEETSNVPFPVKEAQMCSVETGGRVLAGKTGTAVCLSTSDDDVVEAEEAHVLSGFVFWNKSGSLKTGTLQTLSNMVIDSPSPSFSLPAYVTSITMSVSESFYKYIKFSNAHRTPGTTPLSLYQETKSTSLTTGYRDIPDVTTDHDGITGTGAVTKIVKNSGSEWNAGVSRIVCGMGLSTLSARIADCATRHATRPSWDAGLSAQVTWDGAIHGNSGEGSWTLVTVYDASKNNGDTCSGSCHDIWRDDRTGLLWSDRLGNRSTNNNQGRFNWCLASGNVQADTMGSAVECRESFAGSYNNLAYSLCAESDDTTTPTGIHNATTATNLASWANTGDTILGAKGGMKVSTTADPKGSNPSIRWRLPTLNDFYLADINGIRFIHTQTSTALYWSATTWSTSPNLIWSFDFYNGLYENGYNGQSSLNVICVGR